MLQNKTLRLSLFTFLTLTWSFVFFVFRPLAFLQETLPHLGYVLMGWIPPLALLIMSVILRQKLPHKTTSLFGKNKMASIIIYLLPIVCLTVFGVANTLDIQANFYGFYLGCVLLIYALLEEFGWRGYMQEEFNGDKNKWIGYLIIGIVWYLWHWFFLRGGDAADLTTSLIICISLIAASAGIGEIAKSSKSISVCATFHALGNIAMMYPLVSNNITSTAKITTLSICIVVAVFLIKKYLEEPRNAIA